MHVFQTFQNLINNVLFMNIFKYIGSNYCVEICFHVFKYEVNVFIIISADHIVQLYYILVLQLLEEHYLAKCSLGICCVLKSIENFFEGESFFCLSFNNSKFNKMVTFLFFLFFLMEKLLFLLKDYTVGAFPEFLNNFVLFNYVLFDLFCHYFNNKLKLIQF